MHKSIVTHQDGAVVRISLMNDGKLFVEHCGAWTPMGMDIPEGNHVFHPWQIEFAADELMQLHPKIARAFYESLPQLYA